MSNAISIVSALLNKPGRLIQISALSIHCLTLADFSGQKTGWFQVMIFKQQEGLTLPAHWAKPKVGLNKPLTTSEVNSPETAEDGMGVVLTK